MRILVTGSRDWDDQLTLCAAMANAVIEFHGDLFTTDVTVVHGAARGADTIADSYAGTMEWAVEPHRPDWDKYGLSAGIIRNLDMVKAGADVCLAFIRNGSRGASHCADAAERAGIPTYRYLYRNDGGSEHEPRRDPPDSDAPGEAGLPGGSDDYLPIENRPDDSGRIEALASL